MFSRTSPRFYSVPVIEALEERRLLSADLVGVFTGNIPAELAAHTKSHVHLRILNTGDAPAAGPVSVGLFATPDLMPGDGVLLASVARTVKLKVGGGNTLNFNFLQPANLPDGNYSLVAQIDTSAMTIAALSSNIVIAPSPVAVAQPFVDLSAQSVKAPLTAVYINDGVVSGGPASVKVANHGTGAAHGSVGVNFFLSTDDVLDSQDIIAGIAPARMVSIRPGGASLFTTRLDPPATTPGGTYFLFADVVPGAGIVQKNPGDLVGVALKRVEVIHAVPPRHRIGLPGLSSDLCYLGPTIDCEPGDTGVCVPPTTQPTTDTQPTTAPSDTQPTTDPSLTPDNPPASPDDGDTSQPPGDDGSSDGGSSDDDSGDDDSGDDGSGDDSSVDAYHPHNVIAAKRQTNISLPTHNTFAAHSVQVSKPLTRTHLEIKR